ncbi:MAG: GxxExxY protein [Calditrichaeota bacterium]|nr:MAG: GxxExxY protein [Calditrichota bacterium]MBL1206398.1 GxxExxY protein [Calditrichota bacterium]NOG46224.1 GxxExxY protein [Calditrichota bacterium]
MKNLLYEKLTQEIIGACIDVHKELGLGLLESAYEACLCFELSQRQLKFRKQVKLPVKYKTVKLDCAYIIDIVVEDKVVLELKSVDNILPIHEAQLISYLKLSGIEVGLLLNFNVSVMKNGVKRLIKEKM